LDFFLGFIFPSIGWQVALSFFLRDPGTNEIVSGLITLWTMFIYWIFVPCKMHGSTFGKFLFHIKVVELAGAPLTFRLLLKRTFFYWIPITNFVRSTRLGFDNEDRLGHDLRCNTRVVWDKPEHV
jgi:uncharacterized RDD family membrane protein YckC